MIQVIKNMPHEKQNSELQSNTDCRGGEGPLILPLRTGVGQRAKLSTLTP
jgi:hypothetical protein